MSKHCAVITKLRSNNKTNIVEMGEGEYVHFENWSSDLKKMCKIQTVQENKISLSANIDGIPLLNNSTKCTAYQILVPVLQIPHKIYCAAIFCTNSQGSKALPAIEVYLEKFVTDVNDLCANGIETKNNVLCSCSLGPLICDAPVRATLKQVVSHSGYNACERCVQHGEYHCNAVVYLESNCEKRTDATFAMR